MLKYGLLIAIATALAACSAGGPRTPKFLEAASSTVTRDAGADPYVLIDVDLAIANRASNGLGMSTSFFPNTNAGEVVIGVGDTLSIAIVTSNENGFVDFTTASVAPISTTALPLQTVGQGGTVNVPPIGRINAVGKTVPAFSNFLEERLGEVLVDPSVVVEIVDRRSARATVTGKVDAPGTIALNEVNARLIDVIAAAGGPTDRPEDLILSLSRGGSTHSITLQQLFEIPRYNIYARSGDVLSVETPDRKLIVLGAGGQNQTLRFNEPIVALSEAMGRAGGLTATRADPEGVFLYRQISRDAATFMGADISQIAGETIPTIFRFDFRKPATLFAANAFEIADDDLLYISESLGDELDQFWGILRPYAPYPASYVGN